MRRLFIYATLIAYGALVGSASGGVPNVQISRPWSQLQNEEQVFYCPTDSNILIANFRELIGYRLHCAYSRSTDGGITWTEKVNYLRVSENSSQSDPTMAVDAEGNFYMSFIDFNMDYFFEDSSFIVFLKSTDKGASWQGPHQVTTAHGAFFEDKQMITVDRTGGPHHGNVYVAWARFPAPTRIMFARSLDGGVTFEDTLIIGPPILNPPCEEPMDAGHFSQPLVGPDGTVYVVWAARRYEGCEVTTDFDKLYLNKSADGGVTWLDSAELIFDLAPVSFVDGNVGVYCTPSGAVDISDGPYSGDIYVTATNGCQDGEYYHSDITMIKSTDGGETWLPPLRINDDPFGVDVDQFHPWLIVNEAGVLIVIFYDQRNDAAHFEFDSYAAYSFDGGETFTTNQRLSDVSISPNFLQKKTKDGRAGRVAEYIGITAYNDNICAVWTDTRNLNPDVYGAYYKLPFLNPRLYSPADGGYIDGDGDSLVWSTCWHETDVSYHLEVAADSTFGSILLDPALLDNRVPLDSLALADGRYFWRVRAERLLEGDLSDYSEVREFELDSEAPVAALPQSPADGETISDTLPTLNWSVKNSPEFFEVELAADSLFSPGADYRHHDGLTETALPLAAPLLNETTYYWQVNHYDLAGNESGYSKAFEFTVQTFICGDADANKLVNVSDAVYLVVYIFGGGPEPVPYECGDVDCSGLVNISDAVYLIAYIFSGGPPPCAACP